MKDVDICTRLYAFGAERNLPFGYRNGAVRLRSDSSYYEQNTDLFGVIERTQLFDDVYPHREGTVTAVDTTSPLVFVDSEMPFDLAERSDADSASVYKYLLTGTKAKVKFNTGDLAGYEFELASYLHASCKFTVNPINEKFGNPDATLPGTFALPNEALKPRVGDKYVLFDISLPQSYIDAAEEELEQKAQDYLAENSTPQTEYRVTPNEIEFTRNALKLVLGATVHLIDEPLGIDKQIRIVGFERSLDNIYRYSNVALADAPTNALAERKYADYRQQKQIDGSANLAAIANRRSAIIEDVTSNYTTDIDGGLILTTLVQMRGLESDGSLKTNAGISGLTNEVNPVRFWAGSDFDGRNEAPFRVRHDGSVVASNATIAGEIEATSGKFTGEINATSGKLENVTLKTSDDGKRIEIDSDKGNITLYTESDVKNVVIDDGEGASDYINSGKIVLRGGDGTNKFRTFLDCMGILITADDGTDKGGGASGWWCKLGVGGLSIAGDGINIKLTGLPTSAQRLSIGQVYQSGGVLRIVQ
jgi:hypothetical protein